jgi:CubicO group peptidase (beta-lactamase class C family)
MKNLYAFLFFAFSFTAHSQYNFRVADSVLASYNKPDSPGVTVLVGKDGKIIYQKSGGYANIEKGEAITDKTLFNLASDTKQFTAACIIMLEQKGKLKLDDKLSKYFPDFPEYADKITIQQLLNHTTGLMDYRTLAWVAGKEIEDCSNDDIKKMLKMNKLNFEPGSEWSYSNSNYWCLVQIVEQVSDMPIAKFAEKNIFKPLKMRDTYYKRDVAKVKNAARGYELEKNKYAECDKDTGVFGGSGMFSTTADMLKWLAEMDTKKVLGAAFWNAMLNGARHQQAKDDFYSNGLDFDLYRGKKWIYHGGDLHGYHSIMSYFPEENIDIIILTNKGDFKVGPMHAVIASQLFDFKYSWPVSPASPEPVQVSKEILDKYTGTYEAMWMLFQISPGNNGVHVLQLWDNREYDIPATGEALFSEDGVDLLFENIADGKAQLMQITQDGEKLAFKRTDNYELPDLSRFTGRFSCEPLGIEYVFFIKDGKLSYTIGGGDTLPVDSVDGDSLHIDKGDVTLLRDAEGAVNGFKLNHVRIKNLEFMKV